MGRWGAYAAFSGYWGLPMSKRGGCAAGALLRMAWLGQRAECESVGLEIGEN